MTLWQLDIMGGAFLADDRRPVVRDLPGHGAGHRPGGVPGVRRGAAQVRGAFRGPHRYPVPLLRQHDPQPPGSSTTPDGRNRGEPVALRGARRVRRAVWGNGPGAIPAPRPRPTQPRQGLGTYQEDEAEYGQSGLGAQLLFHFG
jgi:hypothetical protein